MPSRNKYGLLPRNGVGVYRPLQVEDPEDMGIILTIISLCRIILRALEMTALKQLQQNLEHISRGFKPPDDIKILINQTVRTLASLRWQLACWKHMTPGQINSEYVQRVMALARALYFWYFAAIGRLPSTVRETLPRSHTSVYADVGEVLDEHPVTETHEAFEEWMRYPYDIIYSEQV